MVHRHEDVPSVADAGGHVHRIPQVVDIGLTLGVSVAIGEQSGEQPG